MVKVLISHLQNKQTNKQASKKTNKQKTQNGGSGSIHELERFNSSESHGTCSLRLNNERKKEKIAQLDESLASKSNQIRQSNLNGFFSLQKTIKILYIQTNILNMFKK